MTETIAEPKPKYLSQRDNLNLDQTPNRTNQCMISSFTMLLQWLGEKYNIEAFRVISEFSYLDIIENTVLKQAGEDRFHPDLHIRVINFMLKNLNLGIELERLPFDLPTLKGYITHFKAPSVLGMNISEFLPSANGHITLAFGASEKGINEHDPFGYPISGYIDHDGEDVYISDFNVLRMVSPKKNEWMVLVKGIAA